MSEERMDTTSLSEGLSADDLYIDDPMDDLFEDEVVFSTPGQRVQKRYAASILPNTPSTAITANMKITNRINEEMKAFRLA
jgi:hypothetical protein